MHRSVQEILNHKSDNYNKFIRLKNTTTATPIENFFSNNKKGGKNKLLFNEF
jgi:hypothetical protein